MNIATPEPKLPSIGDYFSATQLRADRWSALRETQGVGAACLKGI